MEQNGPRPKGKNWNMQHNMSELDFKGDLVHEKNVNGYQKKSSIHKQTEEKPKGNRTKKEKRLSRVKGLTERWSLVEDVFQKKNQWF